MQLDSKREAGLPSPSLLRNATSPKRDVYKRQAVDRDAFSAAVTRRVEECPNITVVREQVERIDESAPILVRCV